MADTSNDWTTGSETAARTLPKLTIIDLNLSRANQGFDLDIADTAETDKAEQVMSQMDQARQMLANDKLGKSILELLENMDKDHDGNFSVTEVVDLARSLQEERRGHSLKAEIDKIMQHPHLTAEDKAALRIMQNMDADGDGEFSGDEVLEACRNLYRKQHMIANLRVALCVLLVILLLVLGAMFTLSIAAYELTKETSVPDSGIMYTSAGGTMIQVAQQRKAMPLASLLYLSTDFHQQLESLTVKVDKGVSKLTLRVQEVLFTPAPEPMEGVQMPSTRRVTAVIEVFGTVMSSTRPDTEGNFQEGHMRGPAEAAVKAMLPDDALPLELSVDVSTQVEVFGDGGGGGEAANSSNVSSNLSSNVNVSRRLRNVVFEHDADWGRRLLEATDEHAVVVTPLRLLTSNQSFQETLKVESSIKFEFSTSRKSLASLDGLKNASAGFVKLLQVELRGAGFNFTDLHGLVTEADHDLLPQLRIKAQSGAEVMVFDAGHAELRRPGLSNPDQFCASCGDCSAVSIDNPDVAKKAEEARIADLQVLNRPPGGRRLQLLTCAGCSADFPPRKPGTTTGQQKYSRTGPSALPCSILKVADDQVLTVDNINAVKVKNMKALMFGDFTVDEFESATQCGEMAWLHRHTCGRNSQGKVRVSFSRQAGQYGRCYCEASFGATQPVMPDVGQAAVYEGWCEVEQAPRLFIGMALLALRDDNYYGVHYTKQNFVDAVESNNKFFAGTVDPSNPGDDTRIRFFALSMRTQTSTSYYSQCWEKMSQMAMELAPSDAASMTLFSCAGNENDGPYGRTNGWTLSTSITIPMEGTPQHKRYAVWVRDDILEGLISSPGTLPHELGHALGLKHTWGSSSGSCSQGFSDFVPDTPHNIKATGSCAVADTCPGVGLLTGSDHHENVMSYCSAKQEFTYGQMARMMETVVRARPSMWLRGAFWPLPGCSGNIHLIYQADNPVWQGEFVAPGRDGCVQLCIPDPLCMGVRYTENTATCELFSSISSAAAVGGVQCWWRKQWSEVMRAPRKLHFAAVPTGATPSNYKVWQSMTFEKQQGEIFRGRPVYKNVDVASPGQYLIFLAREQRWQLSPTLNPASTARYAFTNSDAAYPGSGVWEMYLLSRWWDYEVHITEMDTELDTAPINLDTVCGNGKKEAGEACDDGNIAPFDQCAPDCQDGTKYLFLRTERDAGGAFAADATVRFAFSHKQDHYGLWVALPADATKVRAELTIKHAGGVNSGNTAWQSPQHQSSKYDGVEGKAAVMWVPSPIVAAGEKVSFKIQIKFADGSESAWSAPMCWLSDGCDF